MCLGLSLAQAFVALVICKSRALCTKADVLEGVWTPSGQSKLGVPLGGEGVSVSKRRAAPERLISYNARRSLTVQDVLMAGQGAWVVVGSPHPNKVARARQASPALHAHQKRQR